MRSLRFDQLGNLDHLHLQDVPKPTLAPDEVLVQIYAASLNPSDVKNVQGKMEATTLPRTPGRDFAGVVVEGPSGLLGQAVWGAGGDIGFTRRVTFDLVNFYHRRLTLHGVDSRAFDTVACGNILDALNSAFESGQLRPPTIKHRFTLDDFSAAYQALDHNELQGKAVFVLKSE